MLNLYVQIAELQAQLAAKDAELSSTVPPTPRTYTDEAARAAREARVRLRLELGCMIDTSPEIAQDAQALREQQAIKQQIAHFQLLFVNSANVDVKRVRLSFSI